MTTFGPRSDIFYSIRKDRNWPEIAGRRLMRRASWGARPAQRRTACDSDRPSAILLPRRDRKEALESALKIVAIGVRCSA